MRRVGINGLGRIGRAVFRINLEREGFDVVAVNDINPDNRNLAYLLKYDSTYDRLPDRVDADEESLTINDDDPIAIFHEESIANVPWQDLGVELVVDASGVHENVLQARRLKGRGVKKCIVTHSPEAELVDKTVIVGVNEDTVDLGEDFLISSSICDANAFAPTMHLLDREFGIDHGFVTTLHPWLPYQNLLDGPSPSFAYPGEVHHHFVLGRSSLLSLIPKPTSCVSATEKILPGLKHRFMSFSYRVPTAIVSSADVSVKLDRKVELADVVGAFEQAAESQKFKIFHLNDEPLVSIDFRGCEYSAVVDKRWLMLNHDNYLKVVLWYDNEWGYASRVVDLVGLLLDSG